MKILFAGGGTLGPVTPLIAAAGALKRMRKSAEFVWVGTEEGPERALVEAEGIAFRALPTAKWPRYPTLDWVRFPFRWMQARRVAGEMLGSLKPDVIVTAGGYTAVPLAYAGARAGIPCVAHQLDLVPGWSNRAVARRCASMSTSFAYAHPPFPGVETEQIPTPVRFSETDLPSKKDAVASFSLGLDRPIILLFGGGTGSQPLNAMVDRTFHAWLGFSHLIHVTGVGRDPGGDVRFAPGYVKVERLDAEGMRRAYAAADLVISRAGIGTISEIASLKKPAILVPIPGHQEANARALEERGAAMVMDQRAKNFDEGLLEMAGLAMANQELRMTMGETAGQALPTDDGTALAERVVRVGSR